ncbi:MAG: hypothetical protein LBU89_13145 [Fibromonadaceae bacterium]|jgi:predicted AAA+ superfamily ATPase|nr:hypothetical protein [Fibromonadaceae bacterium]
MKLIDRPEYLEKLKMWLEHTDVIKIVTGVRRCGKSIINRARPKHLAA